MKISAWIAVFGAALAMAGEAGAGTLEDIKERGELRFGYRTDAPPFSYTDDAGEAAGYSVTLCKAIAANIRLAARARKMEKTWIPVTAERRFKALETGEIDILCGATTHTLARRKTVDFSIMTYLDGASTLFRVDGPSSLDEIGGGRVGVRLGTTTEAHLKVALANLGAKAKIVAMFSHDDGVKALSAGAIDAYFADRSILAYLAAKEGEEHFRLGPNKFSHEPYALGLRHGDSEMRLAVDRALSQVFRSGRITTIIDESFAGPPPTELVRVLLTVVALPE